MLGQRWARFEEIYAKLNATDDKSDAERFQDEINKYFGEAGIGWQLVRGQLQIRGSDALEQTVTANRFS
jgi:hypothetical protein